MIDSWRQTWSSKTNDETPNKFPFGFVQLGTNEEQISESNPNSNWPLLCWHQTGDKGSVPNEILPNTFMATAMDTHDHESPYGAIHPRDKLNSLLHPDLNGLLFMKLIPSHIIIAKVWMPKLSREKPKSLTVTIDLREVCTEGSSALAYLWRQTPCLTALQCPVYSADAFRLPLTPWIFVMEV